MSSKVQDRAEFDTLLMAPLPGQRRAVKPSPREIESEGAEFLSFMAQMTGTG